MAIPRIFMPAPFCLGQKEAKFCRFYNHKTKVTFTCKEKMEEKEGGRGKKMFNNKMVDSAFRA